MNPIGKVRRQNLEQLIQERGSLESVAAAAETTSVYLSQVRRQAVDRKTGRPREMGSDMARRLEGACGKPLGWMDMEHPPNTGVIAENPPRFQGTEHKTLHLLPASTSPRATWGEPMHENLPEVFSVSIPDDSMAPRVRRGDVIRLNRSVAPRPGDGVLVLDRDGRWFFRLYSERRPGEWEAHPLNAVYQPLDSQRDGLTVLAVLVGIEEQRWG